MSDINISIYYDVEENVYSTNLQILRQRACEVPMTWDTGANKSIIYSNLLSSLIGASRVRWFTADKIISKQSSLEIYKKKYVTTGFSGISGNELTGILCCLHKVQIGKLELENFYFYLVPADIKQNTGLLGADFISCCVRDCQVKSDEIVTGFDMGVYEEFYKEQAKKKKREICDLRYLQEDSPISFLPSPSDILTTAASTENLK